jgi:serine protease Do
VLIKQVVKPLQMLGLIGVVMLFGTIANAQVPPQELVVQVKKAVVIITAHDQQGRTLQQGSGFFIAADRIITNLHVVRSAHDIRIQTFNGSTVDAESIVASDEISDLALLAIKSPSPGTTTLSVEELGALEGESVMVVSNPRGSDWKVTTGQVGASWNFEHVGTRMQITASLQPGSSGGPVVNLQGHVVGVAAMHIEGADDLDFAIPAERIERLGRIASLRPRK